MGAFADSGWTNRTIVNAVVTPNAPGVSILGVFVGLSQVGVAILDATLLGATGGTLDIVVQSSVDAKQDGTGNWYDIMRYTTIAAGAAASKVVATFSRGFNKVTSAPNVTSDASTGATLLTSGQMIPDALGNAIRIVAIANASTSAGAAQTIRMGVSK